MLRQEVLVSTLVNFLEIKKSFLPIYNNVEYPKSISENPNDLGFYLVYGF